VSETALLYDGALAVPVGACQPGDNLLLDARHHGAGDVLWADNHVKPVKARPTGSDCIAMDKQVAKQFVILDPGPFQGRSSLSGIPYQLPDGSWGLRP
jgi:hypothetical protein